MTVSQNDENEKKLNCRLKKMIYCDGKKKHDADEKVQLIFFIEGLRLSKSSITESFSAWLLTLLYKVGDSEWNCPYGIFIKLS